MKKNKIIKRSVIALIALLITAVFAISYFVSWKLISPEREKITSNPKKEIGLDYEDISFMSEGNKIKAWYIPAKENRFTLVYSHGYSSNREKSSVSTYNLAPIIHKMGGNFLSYDFSGEGESEGKTVTVGYREQEDLKNAIKEAHKKSKSPVFLYGLSMGAATTSIVAGNSNNIAGAICDSPFSNLRSYLESNLEVWSGLPKYPFQPIILNMEEKIAGVKLDKVDPQNSVKKLKVPMLIIHGKGDEKIPYTESIKIAENNKKMIQLKLFENKGHCKSLESNRDEYINLITNFINSNLNNTNKSQ